MQVVLFDQNSVFHKNWSHQFVQHDPLNRKRVGMNGSQSVNVLTNTIVNAARVAAGAELIFAVGHGGAELSSRGPQRLPDATALSQGMVDLAPGRKMRLARGGKFLFVDPFYNFVFPHPGLRPMSDMDNDLTIRPAGAANRLQNWALYQRIGAAMRSNHVYRVVFLTCNIGNAVNFIKKIAMDWSVLVRAYKRFVWFVGTNPAKVCLDGDENGGPTLTADSAFQLPQVDFVTVGPPLPATKP